jgi:DHA2 family multidrug resistance protein
MTALAFATLPTYQIAEASGAFTLVRNFGSSLFISVAVVLLVWSTTENYGRMTEFINPFNKALAFYGVSDPWNTETASGFMRPSNEIPRQPAMIGYVNSFHLLALVAAVGVPLVWFMRLRTVHV